MEQIKYSLYHSRILYSCNWILEIIFVNIGVVCLEPSVRVIFLTRMKFCVLIKIVTTLDLYEMGGTIFTDINV